MRKTTFILAPESLNREFERCCKEYSSLHITVAWCGNPKTELPHNYVKRFGKSLIATIGIAFHYTHPDAIDQLLQSGADVRIASDDVLFHPKLYLFTSGTRCALLVGSSNFTFAGFCKNTEVNALIEGDYTRRKDDDVWNLLVWLKELHLSSEKPTPKWLRGYRRDYMVAMRKARRARVPTPPISEAATSETGWLEHATWDFYYTQITNRLRRHGRTPQEYHDVLDAAAKELPIPWQASFFEDIEKRRIMAGYGKYGWLGHVGASGDVRRLFARGTTTQRRTIAKAINRIAVLELPIDWRRLEQSLGDLVDIGPTMKVWSRLLCLMRPDLYCTVASPTFRQNLSRTLKIPQALFVRPEGYLQLIKLIHNSPWFNSSRPSHRSEAAVWKRRVAFLDAIFYEPKTSS